MKIEDIININKDPIEEKIIKAIEDTKDELSGLTTETTCFIYSSVVADNLRKAHVANQIESTTEYDYPYVHQFVRVPKNDNQFYLIDLTYPQFHSDRFEELEEKGYVLLREDDLYEYLEVVGNVETIRRKKC